MEMTYRGVKILTTDCQGFYFYDPAGEPPHHVFSSGEAYDYSVHNGGRQVFIARSNLGKSFGRNTASAILGMQKMIDDDLFAKAMLDLGSIVKDLDTFVFNPNTRRKTGRAKEERGGGRRNKVRGKKAKK